MLRRNDKFLLALIGNLFPVLYAQMVCSTYTLFDIQKQFIIKLNIEAIFLIYI